MLSFKESKNYKNQEHTPKKKDYSPSTKVQANNPTCLEEFREGIICPYPCNTRGKKKLFRNTWRWYSHLLIHRSTIQEKFETNNEFTLRKQAEIKYQKGLAEMVLTLIMAGVIPTK